MSRIRSFPESFALLGHARRPACSGRGWRGIHKSEARIRTKMSRIRNAAGKFRVIGTRTRRPAGTKMRGSGSWKRILPIADVAGEGGGRGAGHIAGVAAVVVDVAQHVITQQPLQRKPLAAVGAREGRGTGSSRIISCAGLLFLPLAVVQEFYLK
jgi:hypothetical protein